MPRQVEALPSPWLAKTRGELAQRLGVGRNAPTAWQQIAESPAPAELCEFQWRVWGEATGRRFVDPTDPKLIEQLAAAGVERYRQQQAGKPASAPTSVQDITLSAGASLDEQRRMQTFIMNQERLLALQTASRKLISQTDVIEIIERVGKVCAGLVQQIPDWAQDFATTGPEQARLRGFLAERVEAACLKVKESAIAELKHLVDPSQ